MMGRTKEEEIEKRRLGSRDWESKEGSASFLWVLKKIDKN